MSGSYTKDKCVHWRCITHGLHLRRGVSVWSGSVILSRRIHRNLQYGLSAFSVDGFRTPVRGLVDAGEKRVFALYLDNQVWRRLTVVGVINAYYTADFVKHELGEHQQFAC